MTSTAYRMINRLEVQYRDTENRPAGLYIDGVRFPYYIHPEVDFHVVDGVAPSAVVQVFANAITVIGVNGEVDEKVAPTLDNDVEWVTQTVAVLEALGFKITPPTAEVDAELADIQDGEAPGPDWATQAWINLWHFANKPVGGVLTNRETRDTLKAFLDQAPEKIRTTATAVLTEGDTPS